MYEDAGHVEDDFFYPRQQISRSWSQILPSRHGHFLFDPTVLAQVTDDLVSGFVTVLWHQWHATAMLVICGLLPVVVVRAGRVRGSVFRWSFDRDREIISAKGS